MPASLLYGCVGADLKALVTNADLAAALMEQTQALARCNADIQAVKALQPEALKGKALQPAGE